MKHQRSAVFSMAAVTVVSGWILLRAQDSAPERSKGVVPHAECTFFGPAREKYVAAIKDDHRLGRLTRQVTGMIAAGAGVRSASPLAVREGARTKSAQDLAAGGMIDKYIFQAISQAGVQPADLTNDY